MTLRFILGRAGCGKTFTCLNEIREQLAVQPDGSPMIFLVPEQATFQMEYALTTTPGLDGLIRAEVLSFRRLAFRILSETGGAARVPIGELGKRMVLRDLLERHKVDLRVFNRCCDRPGFADALARGIGEMKIYQIKPDDLVEASEVLPGERGLLKDKLADLSLLYGELNTYMAERYTDPDDYLNLLADKISYSSFLDGAEIWVDGFTGFTPQEIYVLQKLMKQAKRVNVVLCLDPKEKDSDLEECDMFYPTWETYHEIAKAAGDAGIIVEEPLLLESDEPHRFKGNPAINHLEKNYFQYPSQVYDGETKGVRIFLGANRRAEVEAVARELIRLSREKGYRWRDMAIVMRGMEPYHELIKTVFVDYNIPHFIDGKRGVMHHPLIELIRSALEVAVKDWSYESVFRYLKTDLTKVTREEVDILENYVLAHGIRSYKWTEEKDWYYRRRYTLGEDGEISLEESEYLEGVNKIRRKAVEELNAFVKGIKDAANPREITTLLFNLLESIEIPSTLELWAKSAQENGFVEKSREHGQVWNGVISLFDEIVEALGDEVLGLDTYASILDVGFESMKLGVIPPGLDQVLVGSLDRSRNPNLQAVFVMGVSEGVLPARPNDDGIFNDSEREELVNSGIRISPGGRRKVFEEQYLVYTALTRAGEVLTLSYPMADEEGKAIPPSSVITRLKSILPNIEERIFQVEPTVGFSNNEEDLEFLVRQEPSLGYLASRFREVRAGRKINPIWWDLYNWFIRDEDSINLVQPCLKGVYHQNEEKSIPKQLTKGLFGSSLRASVSRIEKFNACPFAHFINYGLGLRDRNIYQLAAPDMGEFFHAALKAFADYLKDKGIDWGTLKKDDCIDITAKVVDELVPQLQSEILLSTGRYKHISRKLKRTVERAALILTEHAKRSVFRPVGLELAFGPGGELPPVEIKISPEESLQLVGRIDRVDLGTIDDKTFLRVIDYKSSDNQVRIDEVYHGLKLQLLTYLHVVLTHCDRLIDSTDSLPGGILYFTVKEPLITASGPMAQDFIEKEILKRLKMKGLLLADANVIRGMDNQLDTGYSELFSVALKKDGSFYSSSSVVTSEEFGLLRNFLERSFQDAGRSILQGDVEISPYQKGNQIACTFCAFRPICQFDILLEENKYRLLPSFKPEEIWKKFQKGGE